MRYYDDKPINPNEYVYINGLGFANNLPNLKEKQLIKSYSCLAGVSIILVFITNFFMKNFVARLVEGIVSYFFPFMSPVANMYLMYSFGIIFYAIAFLAPFFLYSKMLGMPIRVALPFKKPDGKKVFGIIGMAMGCSAISIVATKIFIFFMKMIGIEVTSAITPIPSDVTGMILYTIYSVIVVAFVEEIVFRGFLLQSLRRFGDNFALFIAAVIFAAIHANLYQLPVAFIMGLVLGFSVIVTGSLWTGIIIHMLHNLYLILVEIVQENMPPEVFKLVIYSVFAVFIAIFIVSILSLARKSDYIFDLNTTTTCFTRSQKVAIYFSTFSMIFVMIYICLRTLSYVHIRF